MLLDTRNSLALEDVMTSVKTQAIDLISAMPDDCTLEDIQYHLYVREKVERGIQAIEADDVVSHDEAKERVKQWLESYGVNQR